MTTAQPNGPRVVVIYGGKGGIGKTTTATDLAYLSGESGHKTLLIDANTDQPSAHVIYSALKAPPPYDVSVEENPELLSRLDRTVYSRVIIDCPPSPREARAAIDAAHLVIVPYVPRFLETKAIMRTISGTLGGCPYRVLFTGVTHGMRNRAALARESLAGFSVPVFAATVRDRAAHEKTQANGMPVFAPEAVTLDPRAPEAASDYRQVYAELDALLAGGAR
jgi:chromosome partitioning protein